ncbi:MULTISPECIES: DUF4865 family protein [Variovorax]|uniref:DUF4865 family protein n=1 Tax=Variovorax TaxID=34072 RepID=UPI00286C5388|nr:DUF4865 family protein [Variovorax sp. 3319]
MQYSFVLPADYDMDIIDRRVTEKGHALDNHKPLVFKSYTLARQGEATTKSNENLYAPFYVWHDTDGMNDFLCSEGFKRLVASFGWPIVRAWPLVVANEHANISLGKFATREIVHLDPFTALDELRASESLKAKIAVESEGAVAAVSAFEPSTWTLVRFRAWSNPRSGSANIQAYEIAHVSRP